MGKRLSFDEKLAAVRQLRNRDPSPELAAEIRKAIGDRSNFIVATAAAVVGDRQLVELTPDLESAFDRFLVDPLKTDKLCRAKLAIVQALDAMEHPRAEIFERAAGHVQMEPSFGPPVDTAAPLRAAAILALTRIGGSELLNLLVERFLDPEKEVRIAVATALGAEGSDAACLLLRFKARLGDGESDVVSECLSGLLNAAPRAHFPFVVAFLESDHLALCDAAVLALGRSRLPEAVDALKARWQGSPPAGVRDHLLLALAMLRLPAATDFLIELLGSESESVALEALTALKIHRHDPRIRERIGQTLETSTSRTLRIRFAEGFPEGC